MREKGSYGDTGLPLARRYVYPASRWPLIWTGLAVAAVIVGLIVVNVRFQQGRFVSNGPLSSGHASFESECGECHGPQASPSDQKCGACHENVGDELGAYSFNAHYIYRSGDFGRATTQSGEVPCHACHTEHEGREAAITRVPDSFCVSCHEYGSFNRDHPEFEFRREANPDAAFLEFPHTQHVAEVMKERGFRDVEKSCLLCHRPDERGVSFEPLDFDRLCDRCHLKDDVGTPRLPVGDPADPEGRGVLTLAAIQNSQAPGTTWSFFFNPGEFRQVGRRVQKRPLHHRDPWVLENLRRIRSQLFPDAGLAGLLRSSADVGAADQLLLYREAIATLRGYAVGLRSSPDSAVQDELARVEELLTWTERRLEDPYLPLDETKFALSGAFENPLLTDDERAELEELVDGLTEACRKCHQLDGAAIRRVQSDQSTLIRAKFNHRTHILQKRCWDCHREIPILEKLGDAEPVPPELDNAAIQNLPSIEVCGECHTPQQVSNRCVTCHDFHPDKSHRANLLRYLDQG